MRSPTTENFDTGLLFSEVRTKKYLTKNLTHFSQRRMIVNNVLLRGHDNDSQA